MHYLSAQKILWSRLLLVIEDTTNSVFSEDLRLYTDEWDIWQRQHNKDVVSKEP